MNMKNTISILAGVLLASVASGQDLTHKAPPQEVPIAIVDATIHPVSSATIEKGWILFENGRITDMGAGQRPFNRMTRTISGEGLHVYPGLIAASTQMGLNEHGAVAAAADASETGRFTPEVRAIVAVNPDSTHIPVARSAGILTVGVFPTGGTIAGRVGVMSMDGWTWEEMALEQDAGLAVNWPNVRPIRARWNDQSPEEQMRRVREDLRFIDDAFESAEAYVAARAEDPSQREDIRLEAMRGVLAGAGDGRGRVFISAQDVDQITSAVMWAKERGVKAVIVGGRDAPLCANVLVENGVPVIVRGTHSMPKRDDSPYDDAYTLPARLEAAGVTWCLASGEESAHERNLPHHAGKAVAHGLSRDAAIRAITLTPAEILGVADRVGSLGKGMHATIMVTDGDPLEITTTVRFAFIEGRELDLTNKQTKLDEKYRERYRQRGEPPAN